MKKLLLWARIIRPQTLFASAVPVVVGLLVTRLVGVLPCGGQATLTAAFTLVSALSLQVFSNLVNDYYDYCRGADRRGRVGYKRALAEGEVTVHQMLVAVGVAAVVAVVTGAYLIVVGGWPILLIGVSALFFAWLYTATRHSLSYLGVADIFVFLYYGVIATAGTAYLQMGVFCPTAFYAGAVCGLISMCVLMTNNLRDRDGDRAVGKRTLPVRFGKRKAEAILLAEVLLMPLFAWLAFGLSPTLLVVVPALALYVAIKCAEGPQYNRCLLACGLTNVVYCLLVVVEVVW